MKNNTKRNVQPTAEFTRQIMEMLKSNLTLDFPFNKNGEPPYALVNPERNDIAWVCGYDQEDKLISIFRYLEDGQAHRHIEYISLENAKLARNEMLKENWIPMQAPTIAFDD